MNKFLIFVLLLSLTYCSVNPVKTNIYSIDYSEINKIIKIEKPTTEQTEKFNRNSKSEKVTLKKDTLVIEGYLTNNKEFYAEIIKPYLIKNLDTLKKLPLPYAINEITLLIHQLYREFVGQDFYRWGGDLNDLDDPQGIKHRGEYKYGLDCSGFTTSAYEAAIDIGLLNNKKPNSVFSSKGFEHYCILNNIIDSGGINDTKNNYRVDTKELAFLGNLVFSINKGEKPTKEQISMLQPGDIVGRSGHFGIIVFINNIAYYLESGGWVVPQRGGLPYLAEKALEIFAQNGNLYIRRAL